MTGPDEKPPKRSELILLGEPDDRRELARLMLQRGELSPPLLVVSDPKPMGEYVPGIATFELPVENVEIHPSLKGWLVKGPPRPWQVYRLANDSRPIKNRGGLREGDSVYIQEPFGTGYRRMTVRASRTTARGRYLEDASIIVLLTFRKKWGWTYEGVVNRRLWDPETETILPRVREGG